MTSQTSSAALDFAWRPQPEAAALVAEILRDHQRDCPPIRDFADQLLSATGTRLLDWVDHVALPAEEAWEARLVALGFSPLPDQPYFWTHPEAELPRIALHDNGVRRVAIRVDSVVDFLVMHRLHQTPIEGPPLARLRRARIAAESGTEFGSSSGTAIGVGNLAAFRKRRSKRCCGTWRVSGGGGEGLRLSGRAFDMRSS